MTHELSGPFTESGTRHVVAAAAQEGMWFLEQLVPGSPAANLSRTHQVCGALDLDVLRGAWQAVVDRHEMLRTALVEVDGRLMQRIAPAVAAEVALVELPQPSAQPAQQQQAQPRQDRQQQAQRRAAELAGAAFILSRAPLARLEVIRLSATEHHLVLTAHEAAADDRSMTIMMSELCAHYGAASGQGAPAGQGAAPVLSVPAALTVQYADYARWQAERAAAPEYGQLLEWWTAALTPQPPALDLPTDRARPAGPADAAAVLDFDWDLGWAPHQLAQQANTTAGTVLLTAWLALLARHSGTDRVSVGVPATLRPRPAFDRVVGPLTNLLPLCADVPGAATFRELLGRVAQLAEDAQQRRQLPFTDLVRALNVDRDPRRLPLCEAAFHFQDGPEPEPALPGAQVRLLPAAGGHTRVDLALTVSRAAPTVRGHLRYRSSLFDAASAGRLLQQLRTLLAAALADPDRPVQRLPLDCQAGSGTNSSTAVDAPEPVTQLVHRQASAAPLSPALWWDGSGIGYRKLWQQAAGIAAELGDVAGAAVAVRMPSGPAQIAALLGVLQAGAHLLWLGAGDTGERGRAVLADLRPVCLLLDGSGLPEGSQPDELATWYASELGGRLVDATAATAAPAKPRRPPLEGRAYVAYTSGSTGRPKGIAQTQAALAQFTSWFGATFGTGPGSRVAQWVAPDHDPALCEVFATLVTGGTLCPVPPRIRANPDKLAGWLATEDITHLQTVPSFARELLKVITALPRPQRPHSLSHLLLMGEALPGELVDGLRAALPGIRLVNLYGPTESIAATWHEVTTDGSGTVPIGRPIPGRQVLLLDDQDRPCPTGVTGNIVIRSPYVAAGYLSPDGSDSSAGTAFQPLAGSTGPGRTYRTGDLARLRWDGLLEFRGRRDFQVKLAGNRVELTDIEAALAAHESVAECAVVAHTDGDGLVTHLVCHVVPRRDADGQPVATVDSWRAQLRARFGRAAALPTLFRTVQGRLPRNAAGKVDRRRLPDSGPFLARPARPPQSPAELAMAGIWSELLGDGPLPDQFHTDDSFFAVGGHSLLLPRLAQLIRERLGTRVSLWDCVANPTLSALAGLATPVAPAA